MEHAFRRNILKFALPAILAAFALCMMFACEDACARPSSDSFAAPSSYSACTQAICIPVPNVLYAAGNLAELASCLWVRALLVLLAVVVAACLTAWFERRRTRRALRERQEELERVQNQLRMDNEAIFTIAHTVDEKDAFTSEHSQRVSDYSVLIAKSMGLSEEEVKDVKKTALLHDIGKIGIPDAILNKRSPLTDEEYELMKTHVTKGVEILKGFAIDDRIVEGVQYHHERYDGTGYASGLKGEEIPVYSRIICVADSFDAMTSSRVYKDEMSVDYALGELERCSGTHFDPKIAAVAIELVKEGRLVPQHKVASASL